MPVFVPAHGGRAFAINRNVAIIVWEPVCDFILKSSLTGLVKQVD